MDFSNVRDWQIPVDGVSKGVLKAINAAGNVIWRKKFLVQFDGNGGIPSESSRYVKYEYAVGALPSALRENYILTGWYTAASGGSSVTPATVITNAVTFYAQWTQVSTDDLLITNQADNVIASSGDFIKIVE